MNRPVARDDLVLDVAFIVTTDNQLEIAEEVSNELRRRQPGCKLCAISRRWFKYGLEYDIRRLQKTFTTIVTPERRPLISRARRLFGMLLPAQTVNRFLPQSLNASYPRLFKRGKPIAFDFVLTTNDSSSADFVRAFQRRNVPVGLVQESIRRDDANGSRNGRLMNGQGGCDVVYAWGSTSVEYYLRIGVDRRRIVATGSPRLDRLVRFANELPQPSVIKIAESLPGDRPIILIATNAVYQPKLPRPLPSDDYQSCIIRAIEWCSQIGAFVVVKPHIFEVKDHASWCLPQRIDSLPNARYRADIDLASALVVADAVMVFSSSVAVEAALLEKPVGMLAADLHTHGVDFLERGLCRRVDSSTDLEALLSAGITSSQNRSLDAYLSVRGKSAQAIVDDMLTRVFLSKRATLENELRAQRK